MDVIVLRHGLAEARGSDDSPGADRARELTDKGCKRMRKGARGLARLVPRLDAIATSSLLRAVQTAEIAGEEYGGLKAVVLQDLEPGGSHAGIASWLASQRPDGVVMLVGHNPGLEELICWLLAGVSRAFLELDKGGACRLSIDTEPGPGSARLIWALPARSLRRNA